MLIERLERIFHEVFDDPGIRLTPETHAADIDGWDSVAQVKLILSIEEEFGVCFDTDEVAGLERVGDVLKALEKRGHAA